MSMDGVDISGHDVPIDVVGLTADFVIVKVTEGTQGDVYNPWWRDMLDEGAQGGKLLGVYHYANGGDPVAEANSFYGYIKAYKGRVVPALDWEGQGNFKFMTGQDVSWCERFMDSISSLMGSTCLFYTSKGICRLYDWSRVAEKYPLWGAEYAYDDHTYQGYETYPWQSDLSWGAWGAYPTIHQYGYVNPKPNNGGQGQLDADKFYGTREDWLRMCGGGGADMALRDKVVAAARSQLGWPYNSMDYGERGWGCAMLCAYAHNSVLGTGYYGSVWNFVGDAMGDGTYDQGGGEFVFTDDPQPGDVVVYNQKGHDGRDATDYGHAALYVGDGRVVGAWGVGNIGTSGYWAGRGVSEDRVEEQSLGNGWRFVSCTRLDEARKPDEVADGGSGAVYRMYDAATGNHLFTASLDEARRCAGWGWRYEGVAFRASGAGTKVYRMYDEGNGDHLLTASKAERDRVRSWMRDEGVAFVTDGDVPVYRLYDRNAGLHFYTSSATERDQCLGWMDDEGVAFWVGGKDGVKVGQLETKPKNGNGFKYRAHSQSAGWLPIVRDGQTAGTEGYAKRLEALGITPPEGMTLDAYCHVQGIGDLYYDNISGKGVTIGTTGQARRMEAIRLVVTKWPDKLKGKRLCYQGHVQGVGWDKVCSEGQWCGTRGKGKRLEAVRIWIE